MTQNNKVLFFASADLSIFEEKEIEWLLKCRKQPVVFSESDNNSAKQDVEFVWVNDRLSKKSRLIHVLRFGFELVNIVISDITSKNTSWAYIKKIRELFSILLTASIRTESLKHYFFRFPNAIVYAYYFNDYALLLAIAKKRGYVSKFYSRAHGRDVVESREPLTKKLPYQSFKYKYTDKVFCISNFTKSYITSVYPNYKSKIEVCFLGTEDNGMGPIADKNDAFVIVSVGTIRNVKRFYLIAEMLLHATVPIKWVHFGDLYENDPTTKRFNASVKALKSNRLISVELNGSIANADLHKYYKSNPIDLLVNTSDSEGLPVSIQEAISFGIPCVATNVGGTSEIVNINTGWLIERDFIAEQTMSKIESILLEHSRDINRRVKIREFWKNNFSAFSNYPDFFQKLEQE